MDRHTREALFVAIREATVVAYGERLISLAVFGSWARGTATPASDLDLLVVAEPRPYASARIPADTLQRQRILGLQA
jgi:predicted nucleotidyltransferase